MSRNKRGFVPKEWTADELEAIRLAKESGIARTTVARGFDTSPCMIAKIEKIAIPEDVNILRERWRTELIGPMKVRLLSDISALT